MKQLKSIITGILLLICGYVNEIVQTHVHHYVSRTYQSWIYLVFELVLYVIVGILLWLFFTGFTRDKSGKMVALILLIADVVLIILHTHNYVTFGRILILFTVILVGMLCYRRKVEDEKETV